MKTIGSMMRTMTNGNIPLEIYIRHGKQNQNIAM